MSQAVEGVDHVANVGSFATLSDNEQLRYVGMCKTLAL